MPQARLSMVAWSTTAPVDVPLIKLSSTTVPRPSALTSPAKSAISSTFATHIAPPT